MGITVRYREKRQKWVVTETVDGSRTQRTFETEREARQYATKASAALTEAVFNGKMGRRPKRTFAEAIAKLVDEYDVSSQASHVRNVFVWMEENAPNVVLGQATLDAARQMQKELKAKGLKQSTINNRVQIVKRVLSLAYKEWDWLEYPLDGKLRKPTPKNSREIYLDEFQMRQLIRSVPEGMPVERKMIILAAVTGMRRGELLALEPGNIVNGRVVLRPGQTKSGKARTIPLPPDAGYLVEQLPFPTKKSRLRKAFETARKAIGQPELRLHDLRHSYASLLADAGETMTSLQALLGHSSLIVTSRYAHADKRRWDVIANKLPQICDQSATKH